MSRLKVEQGCQGQLKVQNCLQKDVRIQNKINQNIKMIMNMELTSARNQKRANTPRNSCTKK